MVRRQSTSPLSSQVLMGVIAFAWSAQTSPRSHSPMELERGRGSSELRRTSSAESFPMPIPIPPSPPERPRIAISTTRSSAGPSTPLLRRESLSPPASPASSQSTFTRHRAMRSQVSIDALPSGLRRLRPSQIAPLPRLLRLTTCIKAERPTALRKSSQLHITVTLFPTLR